MSNKRILIVSLILIMGIVCLNLLPKSREIPIKKTLETFPKKIGNWTFSEQIFFSDKVTALLGVDDYIQFEYLSPDKKKIDLYISYFDSQKEGKGFHSPKNCMPGAGWNVVQCGAEQLEIHHSKPKAIEINKMIIQRGAEQAIVFYWFQSRGRFIRSEYMQKIYLVLDSILKRRTDGSFVRIMMPTKKVAEEQEMEKLREFAEQVIYILKGYLPGS